ncbi:retrovirus-related pol polyprotein from transposon TNT 1-94 [Tanacetum coccineum]
MDSGCSKHMPGNLELLINTVKKFMGTVRFKNDQFAPIQGYGDLVQENVTIKQTYYVEGINRNLFSVGHFYDADLEVHTDSFSKIKRQNNRDSHQFPQNDSKRTSSSGINHQTSIAQTPEQNDVVERHNRTLVEAARTMLSAAKLPLFLWAEAIATAFRDGKNLDKMIEKGDACIFVGYATQSKGLRVYNKKTRIIIETIPVNFDELKEMTFEQDSSSLTKQHLTTTSEQNSLGRAP